MTTLILFALMQFGLITGGVESTNDDKAIENPIVMTNSTGGAGWADGD